MKIQRPYSGLRATSIIIDDPHARVALPMKTISDIILNYMTSPTRGGCDVTHLLAIVNTYLPTVRRSSILSILSRLAKAGRIRRAQRGVYESTTTWVINTNFPAGWYK